MTQELEAKLFAAYPLLFPGNRDIHSSCMGFGFECGDGWFFIIDKLCSSIQNYVTNNKKPQPVVVQVKEKFGTLRLYIEDSDQLIDGMIWFAEDISGVVCELCGRPGKLNKNGWIACRCDSCRANELAH